MKIMQKNKLAIFDIDGTIFRSSLLIELSHALVNAGIFPKIAREEIAKEFTAWLNRKGTYDAYINKVVKIYNKHIAGKDFSKVDRVTQKVIGYQKDRVYRFTRDLIKRFKKENYLLTAISGSPAYIVQTYAKAIGFDLFFGTELEIVGGKFTGRVVNLDSALNKSKIVKSLVKKYPGINLKKSVAIGDTGGDILMLSLVGNPIAFNPNFELAASAKRKKWPIVVERKDVVYGVREFKFLKTSG